MVGSTVTLLVPHQLLDLPQGSPLHGYHTTTLSHLDDMNPSNIIVITLDNSQKIIGEVDQTAEEKHNKLKNALWVVLEINQQIQLQFIQVQGKKVNLTDVNLVLYNNTEICYSELIAKKYSYIESMQQNMDTIPYFVHCVQSSQESRDSYQWKILRKLLIFGTHLILLALFIPKVILEKINSLLKNQADYQSTALQQILLRIKQLMVLKKELEDGKGTLIIGRLLTLLLLDVVLGVGLAVIISYYLSVGDIYSNFCEMTQMLANNVVDLLEWLSGAPAGLKLNQPLTQTLAAFFSYHVHLWMLYLKLADPLLRSIAWVLVWLGMAGHSIQLAIFSDLLNLATLHLYCFYVYAARLHMLQISLLGSQWRAFRGRKWNPLKQRVDSYEASSHIIRILTALVFTLVIFLLPTTTIYYAVFVSLRFMIFTIQGMLTIIIWWLNVNPVYLWCLNIAGANSIKGDVYFENAGSMCSSSLQTSRPIEESKKVLADHTKESSEPPSEAPLVLHLHTWPTPLTEILTLDHNDVFQKMPRPKWGYIFGSIMQANDLL